MNIHICHWKYSSSALTKKKPHCQHRDIVSMHVYGMWSVMLSFITVINHNNMFVAWPMLFFCFTNTLFFNKFVQTSTIRHTFSKIMLRRKWSSEMFATSKLSPRIYVHNLAIIMPMNLNEKPYHETFAEYT